MKTDNLKQVIAENEELWLEESERRYREYKKGNISARLAEDVLREKNNNR